MKIKLLTGLSGPDCSYSPGDEAEFPNDEAKRLIEAGFAEPVREQKTERATAKVQAEKAAS